MKSIRRTTRRPEVVAFRWMAPVLLGLLGSACAKDNAGPIEGVLPAGQIALLDDSGAIVLVNTEGARLTRIAPPPQYRFESVKWRHDGAEMIAHATRANANYRLYRVTITGQLTALPADSVYAKAWPEYSAHDDRIFFMALPISAALWEVWEMSASGPQQRRIGRDNQAGGNSDETPSASSDGKLLAYVRTGSNPPYDIRVIELASGTEKIILTGGRFPVFSPRSNLIAFLKGGFALSVIQADGTGERRIGPEVFTTAMPTWSPDGRWVLAVRTSGINGSTVYAVEVATNKTIELEALQGLIKPSWRPE